MITIPIVVFLLVTILVTGVISVGITLFITRKRSKENMFLKGKIEGEKETILKFEIKYESFLQFDEKVFKKRAISGYYKQLFYNSLPIGENTKIITNTIENSNDENIKLVIEKVENTLDKIATTVNPIGIPVTIDKNIITEAKNRINNLKFK